MNGTSFTTTFYDPRFSTQKSSNGMPFNVLDDTSLFLLQIDQQVQCLQYKKQMMDYQTQMQAFMSGSTGGTDPSSIIMTLLSAFLGGGNGISDIISLLTGTGSTDNKENQNFYEASEILKNPDIFEEADEDGNGILDQNELLIAQEILDDEFDGKYNDSMDTIIENQHLFANANSNDDNSVAGISIRDLRSMKNAAKEEDFDLDEYLEDLETEIGVQTPPVVQSTSEQIDASNSGNTPVVDSPEESEERYDYFNEAQEAALLEQSQAYAEYMRAQDEARAQAEAQADEHPSLPPAGFYEDMYEDMREDRDIGMFNPSDSIADEVVKTPPVIPSTLGKTPEVAITPIKISKLSAEAQERIISEGARSGNNAEGKTNIGSQIKGTNITYIYGVDGENDANLFASEFIKAYTNDDNATSLNASEFGDRYDDAGIIDLDGDGKVTANEFAKYVKAADANNDGKVTKDERNAYYTKLQSEPQTPSISAEAQERIISEGARSGNNAEGKTNIGSQIKGTNITYIYGVDGENDSNLFASEFIKAYTNDDNATSLNASEFGDRYDDAGIIDLDGDGKVTANEFAAYIEKADTNKDGKVTKDERNAYYNSIS